MVAFDIADLLGELDTIRYHIRWKHGEGLELLSPEKITGASLRKFEFFLRNSMLRVGELLRQLGHESLALSFMVTAAYNDKKSWDYDYVMKELPGLHSELVAVLIRTKFAVVPESLAPTFNKEDLFGNEVNVAFPSAVQDIHQAGNCLALGLNTAAVFHLMRVVECGLRALARRLKLKLDKLLEEHTWGQILKAVREQSVLHPNPKTKHQRELKQFYEDVRLDLNCMKDAWRDRVMHSNSEYDSQSAQHIFSLVRIFMQKLSERVSEKS